MNATNRLLVTSASLVRLHSFDLGKHVRGDAEGRVERGMFGGVQVIDLERGPTQRQLFLEGERFIPESELIRRLVRPGDSIVDVGANIGYYALMFDTFSGGSARLHLIEPSEENLPELHATLERSGLADAELHQVALGSETGEVRIRRGINSGVTDDANDGYTVPIRRLDDLLEGVQVDLVKIDVEGFETAVLEGAEKILAAYRPRIFLEVHPWAIASHGRSTRELFELLGRYYDGYSIWESTEHVEPSGWRRLAARYGFGATLVERSDPERFVETLVDAEHKTTFWAVFGLDDAERQA